MLGGWGSVGLGTVAPCESYVERSKQINADYEAGRITLDEAIRLARQVTTEAKEAGASGRCGGTIWSLNMATILSIESALVLTRTARTYETTAATHKATRYIILAVCAFAVLVWAADQ